MNKVRQIVSLAKIFSNYKRKNTVLTSLPIRLWIEPTNFCNLKCIMCLNKDVPAEEKGHMDFGLFKRIIDEAKDFIYDIYLHHRGESFLHPELVEMIKYAKKAGLNVKIHTNGTLINREISERILDSGLDLVSFSFDGFTQQTYEKIRVNADYHKTVDNIKGFLRFKKEKGRNKPYTVIEEIEFGQYQELYDKEARAEFSGEFRSLGLDEIIFKKLYNWAGDLEVPQPELSQRSYTMCTFLWYSMVVLWDGTVTPCPQDYWAKLKLGNVQDKSIAEIWNDRPYTELRRKLINSVENLNPCCKCDRLYRKKTMGVPFQYMISFLNDNLIGYGRLRRLLGSYERNEQ